MESTKDSIKYIRPVYTNNKGINENVNGHMNDRTFGDFNMNGANGLNDPNYRRATYESTEDRYAQELSNGTIVQTGTTEVFTADYSVGAFTLGYIDGYSAIYLNNESKPLAIQDKSGNWFFTPYQVSADGTKAYRLYTPVRVDNNTFTFKLQVATITTGVVGTFADLAVALSGDSLKTFGRFNSEGDLIGDYLGEVELVMTDYQFNPRPITLGLTWTQMTEIVLDSAYGISAEELLMDYAGQEIKKAQDFRAVKVAYGAALANPGAYSTTFNASAGNGSDDSYLATAQTFSQAVARIGDVMLNDILRGGVTRIVGGPAAVSYLSLNSEFTKKGAQDPVGAHQFGELAGIPVFKVPSNVIPDNELMTVWKNDQNEADVALAFGTLIPFYSTGTIQRKNLYKEAGLAVYEDYQVLLAKYFGRIKIEGLRQI